MSLTDDRSREGKHPPKGGIVVSAQKKRLRNRVEGGELHLSRKPNEPLFQRAIPPTQPRTPFDSAPPIEPSTAPASPSARHHRSRRGLLALLRSRRKGRQRVVNFILLPLAVLAATAIVVWILKFL